MRLFLLSLFVISAGAPAAEAVPPVRAQADLAEYVSETDYPYTALRNGEQGIVRFRLEVGANGRVTNCAITQSSGSPALDQATCHVMSGRPRFTPARDGAGRRVADTIGASLTWVLPPEPAPPAEAARARANLASFVMNNDYPPEALRRGEEGRVEFALDISAEGRVTYCHVMRSSGSRLLDLRTCQIMLVRARFHPARDAEGNAVPDQVQAAITWRIS